MPIMTEETPAGDWYAVRCIFAVGWPPEAVGKTYEERITLWQARSIDEAIERAEAEASEYASEIEESPSRYLGLAQAFHLFGSPADGAEVFSLLRDSQLAPDEYLRRPTSTRATSTSSSSP
jgi:hypothetical protein